MSVYCQQKEYPDIWPSDDIWALYCELCEKEKMI